MRIAGIALGIARGQLLGAHERSRRIWNSWAVEYWSCRGRLTCSFDVLSSLFNRTLSHPNYALQAGCSLKAGCAFPCQGSWARATPSPAPYCRQGMRLVPIHQNAGSQSRYDCPCGRQERVLVGGPIRNISSGAHHTCALLETGQACRKAELGAIQGLVHIRRDTSYGPTMFC